MLFKASFRLAVMGVLALSGCSNEPEEAPLREGVYVVGSSTVFPFAKAVADATRAANPELADITIESTGTAEGITQFCAGVGHASPDIVNASRRMTPAEFSRCAGNGVTEIVELRIGIDGIVFVSSLDGGLSLDLTKAQIYRALAAEPYGEEQTAQKWSDVGSGLPEEDIYVYGPPDTSGTRASLVELVMQDGCEAGARLGNLQASDPQRYNDVCASLRTDGAYQDQGENDDAIVRRVANNPVALAIVGYSWFEENQDLVQAMRINGVAPAADTIASGSYPASRPLFIYVKKAHLELIDGLAPYIAQWAASWGEGGPLEAIGLVISSPADRDAAAATARDMTVLTQEALGG